VSIFEQPINVDTRVGRMLDALAVSDNRRGMVLVTVTVKAADGGRRYHEAFAIKQWAGRDGTRNLSVSIHNSGDWASGIKPITVMHLNLLTREMFPGRDERGAAPLIRYAANAALRFAWTGTLPTPANGSVEAVEAAKCGRCGATLVDPESIARGLGPECASKPTGSRTIRSRERQMQLAEPEPDLAPTG
jgi:hypothetical protein